MKQTVFVEGFTTPYGGGKPPHGGYTPHMGDTPQENRQEFWTQIEPLRGEIMEISDMSMFNGSSQKHQTSSHN